jgi:hypothetical protein
LVQKAIDHVVFDQTGKEVVSVVVCANVREVERLFDLGVTLLPACRRSPSQKEIYFDNGKVIFKSAQNKTSMIGCPPYYERFIDHYAYECGVGQEWEVLG